MPLVRIPAAFDHPDWIFELKHDGFRALARVEGHHSTLVSRRRHVYRQYPMAAFNREAFRQWSAGPIVS